MRSICGRISGGSSAYPGHIRGFRTFGLSGTDAGTLINRQTGPLVGNFALTKSVLPRRSSARRGWSIREAYAAAEKNPGFLAHIRGRGVSHVRTVRNRLGNFD